MKGKSVAGAMKSGNIHKQSSYAKVLIGAYLHLNVTTRHFISTSPYKGDGKGAHQVSLDIIKKKIDVSFFPVVCTEPYRILTDVGAFTTMVRMVFYSARGRPLSPSFPLYLVTLDGYVCLSALTAAILAIYALHGRIMKVPTSSSEMALYLCAIFFGTDTSEPPSSRRTVIRFLLCFWSIAAFLLSSYIESDLTSEACIPTVSQSIDTIYELVRQVELKNIRPCVLRDHFVHHYISISKTGALGTLRTALEECGNDCFQTHENFACRNKVENGTHAIVFVESGSSSDHTRFAEWHRGSETFATFPTSYMASKAFPFLQEHHQIAAALLETGLYMPAQTSLKSTVPLETGYEEQDMFLSKLMLLYSCGCLISVVTLLLEGTWPRKLMPFRRALKVGR